VASSRNQDCGLLETIRRVDIAQLRQSDVATSSNQFCRIQSVTICGFLGLLLEFACLAEGCKFGPLGLIEQAVRFG
jgi:hypothetical protein